MHFHRAVLTGSAAESRMGADPMVVEENLDDLAGDADLYLALDVLVRDRIIHLVDSDVLGHPAGGYLVDGCDLPRRQFERGLRKRQQIGFFLLEKNTESAAFFLLEGFAVEFIQFVPNRLVQGFQGEELLVSDGCKDPGGDVPDRTFGAGWPFGFLTRAGTTAVS